MQFGWNQRSYFCPTRPTTTKDKLAFITFCHHSLLLQHLILLPQDIIPIFDSLIVPFIKPSIPFFSKFRFHCSFFNTFLNPLEGLFSIFCLMRLSPLILLFLTAKQFQMADDIIKIHLFIMVYTIALISGSLRKNSTNTGLLRAIVEANDNRYNFVWVDIHEFPVFNEDIESKGYPAPVQKAREIVGKADGVIFGVAEYNFSISAPLKNAYDWLSRQDSTKYCPVTEKIVSMVSSAAAVAGQNAQTHFRQSVSFRKVKVLEPSESAKININRFNGKFFDENGNLIDQDNRQRIPLFLNEFAQFLSNNKK